MEIAVQANLFEAGSFRESKKPRLAGAGSLRSLEPSPESSGSS